MKIYINKNPMSRGYNMLYGLSVLLDGFVRVFSFGTLLTSLPLDVSREGTKQYLRKIRDGQD